MRLLITKEGNEPREVEVRAGTTIGREQGNDLVLADESASKRHARIVEFESGLALEDLRSASNPTRKEGSSGLSKLTPGTPCPLTPGVRFRIGWTWIEVLEDAAPGSASTLDEPKTVEPVRRGTDLDTSPGVKTVPPALESEVTVPPNEVPVPKADRASKLPAWDTRVGFSRRECPIMGHLE